MTLPMTLHTRTNSYPQEIVREVFGAQVMGGNAAYRQMAEQTITTGATAEEIIAVLPEADLLWSAISEKSRHLYRNLPAEHCVLMISSYSFPDHTVTVAGETLTRVKSVLKSVVDRIPPVEDTPEDRASARFWHLGEHGPVSNTRTFAVPTWESIAGNYPTVVAQYLDTLMQINHTPEGGRLILWHGEAGTGKSTALLALLSAWRRWANIHYIMDNERFFGDGGYMANVLLSTSMSDDDDCDLPSSSRKDMSKANLIIAEDAGEMMRSDAREESGQGLSRLLNLTDGIIGRGLKTLVLLTTNEDIGKLHPAVRRAGRCLAKIPFTNMSHEQARAWCEQHELDSSWLGNRATVPLCDLYAHLNNSMPIGSDVKAASLGFVGAQ